MEKLCESATQLSMHYVFESRVLEECHELGRFGEIRDALGEVAIGGAIGQQSADQRNDLAEVNAVAEPDERIVGNADIEEADPTVRSNHAMKFDEERAEIDEIAKCEAARHAIDAAVRNGQLKDVCLRPWRVAPTGVQHAVGEVDGNRFQSRVCQIDAHVASATSEVEDDTAFGKAERSQGDLSPAHVESEGHDPIHEVVSRRDLVEHVLHGGALFVSLEEAVGVPRWAAMFVIPRHEGRLRPAHAFSADRGAW